MRILLSFVLCTIFTLVCATEFPINCGLAQSEREKRIVGGSESTLGNWPWLVGLRFNPDAERDNGKGEVELMCAGSIIHKRWIITASHCLNANDTERNIFSPTDPAGFTIRIGDHDRNLQHPHQKDIGVLEMHLYDSEAEERVFHNDVALMKLAEDLDFTNHYVQPICLSDEDKYIPKLGDLLTAIGWGHTKENGTLSDVIKEVEQPVIDKEECYQAQLKGYEYRGFNSSSPEAIDSALHYTGDMMCLGFGKGEKDACQYDSGGPVMDRVDGRWYISGLINYGDGCAVEGLYGLYNRLDHIVPWIKRIISEN